MTAPGPSARPRSSSDAMIRSAMIGLGAGLLIGGGYLLFLAWHTFTSELDCAQLTPNECAFHGEALLYLARRQSLFGAALMTIGFATFLMLRSKARAEAAAKEPPTGSES